MMSERETDMFTFTSDMHDCTQINNAHIKVLSLLLTNTYIRNLP